jgi:Ni/Co efflux regulator RcnB
MKKFLAVLLSGVSLSATAGELITDYGVNADGYYGYTDYASPYSHLYKQNNLNAALNTYGRVGYEFNPDYTASLVGYFMIDSAKEVENYNQGKWGEEVYGLFETPMGEMSVGQDYNVAYNFAVGAPNVGQYHVNNTNLSNFLVNPNWYKKGSKMSYKTLNSTYINTDGASFKVNYVTPEFLGMKIGATYVPETYSQSGLVAKSAEYKDKSAYILGAYGSWDILGYELETSLGFADYKDNDKEYSAGASVYRKGWTLGASYRKTDANSHDYALNKENLFDSYRKGEAYNAGISYAIGPFTTGVAYFVSESEKTANKDEIISFSNSYQYNKYTTFSLTVAHQKSETEYTDDLEKLKGYAFILGMELSL